jgi:hypothetical protein
MITRAKELLERVAGWPKEDIELEAATSQIEAWHFGEYHDIDEAEASGIAANEEVRAAYRGQCAVAG